MVIQLTKDGIDMIGSDGRLRVDGRYGLYSTIVAVRDRNESFKKNFPHKVADGFRWNGKIINVN